MLERRECGNKSCRSLFDWPNCAAHNKTYCCRNCREEARNGRRRQPPSFLKRCLICNRLFRPNKYHPTTQILCGRPECVRQRKRELNRNWYLRNYLVFRDISRSSNADDGNATICMQRRPPKQILCKNTLSAIPLLMRNRAPPVLWLCQYGGFIQN